MPNLTPSVAVPADPERSPELPAALSLAAQAVLAGIYRRPSLRVRLARLRPEARLTFAELPALTALRHNRAFLEETVMVALAPLAARQIKFGAAATAEDFEEGRRTLVLAAGSQDEAEAVEAYLQVLLARARAALRHRWAEVEVLGLALLECGALDETEIAHRLNCVQGIRSATLN